jgi:hypothetical protein
MDLVTRFATTPERQAIIAGLLAYRHALHATGLVRGFQWLDGSFAEHVEVIEQRPPNDIDVVTFYGLRSTSRDYPRHLRPDPRRPVRP